MAYNAPGQVTTGLGTEVVIKTGLETATPPNALVMSAAGVNPYPSTYQLETEITDVSGSVLANLSFTLTSVANVSAGATTYTGTVTGGTSNAFANLVFFVQGFTNVINNGYYLCIGSSTTTLVLLNPNGASETHAATAKSGAYYSPVYLSRNPAVASVDSSGVITAVAVGYGVIEISYPFANNALGTAPDGTYIQKVWEEINVKVLQ